MSVENTPDFMSVSVCVLFFKEDGKGVQLSLCDGKTQSGFQRDDHQPCIVSPDLLLTMNTVQLRDIIYINEGLIKCILLLLVRT